LITGGLAIVLAGLIHRRLVWISIIKAHILDAKFAAGLGGVLGV
jgi:hypothetical protein